MVDIVLSSIILKAPNGLLDKLIIGPPFPVGPVVFVAEKAPGKAIKSFFIRLFRDAIYSSRLS
jgi:hypothetical protein